MADEFKRWQGLFRMKFGTSGLRGLSADLKGRASALYATAFGQYLLESGQAKPGDLILIGRDFRDSSPEIADNCTGVAERAWLHALSIAAPSRRRRWRSTACRQSAACLMITGSHIPADRNGIKFYRPDGEIDKADEAADYAVAAAALDAPVVDCRGNGQAEDHSAQCLQLFFERNAAILPAKRARRAEDRCLPAQHRRARPAGRSAGALRRRRHCPRPFGNLHSRSIPKPSPKRRSAPEGLGRRSTASTRSFPPMAMATGRWWPTRPACRCAAISWG